MSRGGVDLGYNLSNWASLRLGFFVGRAAVDVRSSASPISDFHFRDAFFRAQLTLDTLDEVYFPSHGQRGNVVFDLGEEALGADGDYQDLSLFGLHASSFGRTSILLLGELGWPWAVIERLPAVEGRCA